MSENIKSPKVGETTELKAAGNRGKGRKKGVPNKNTTLLKDAILMAAEKAGNDMGDNGMVSYLEFQATENPNGFMTLMGKVLPMQINGSGDSGEHVITYKWLNDADQDD
tara:strand:+ start:153 stop:479 length:327 start_codon:yes stop_codon:yes gene_type:complete